MFWLVDFHLLIFVTLACKWVKINLAQFFGMSVKMSKDFRSLVCIQICILHTLCVRNTVQAGLIRGFFKNKISPQICTHVCVVVKLFCEMPDMYLLGCPSCVAFLGVLQRGSRSVRGV